MFSRSDSSGIFHCQLNSNEMKWTAGVNKTSANLIPNSIQAGLTYFGIVLISQEVSRNCKLELGVQKISAHKKTTQIVCIVCELVSSAAEHPSLSWNKYLLLYYYIDWKNKYMIIIKLTKNQQLVMCNIDQRVIRMSPPTLFH